MKLKALALGVALALPALASAQGSNVTLYGTIDTGIHYINNIGPGESNYVGFANPNTNSWPSFWGLRGSEKISDNLEGIFNLESGFNPNTGTSNQSSRLFGRSAWVGLKGNWGQLMLGRQYSMLHYAMMRSDIIGPNAFGSASLDGYIADKRTDNAIGYIGDFSGVKFGATYGKGRDEGNSDKDKACGQSFNEQTGCVSYSAMLGYDAANWGANVVYDVLTGSDAARVKNAKNMTNGQADRRLGVNGWAKFDALTLGAFYVNRNKNNDVGPKLGTRSDQFALAAAYALTPAVTIDGSVGYINYKHADEGSRSWLYVARVKYALSKRTSVYASAAFLSNKGLAANGVDGGSPDTNPSAGNNQTGLMAGIRHNF